MRGGWRGEAELTYVGRRPSTIGKRNDVLRLTYKDGLAVEFEFADDTGDALASGCDGAAVALIERSLASATALLGAPPRLLLHGGGAPALAPRLPAMELRPHLVLEGLACWSAMAAPVVPGADAA